MGVLQVLVLGILWDFNLLFEYTKGTGCWIRNSSEQCHRPTVASCGNKGDFCDCVEQDFTLVG